MGAQLETELVRLDAGLAAAERQAKAMLSAVRALRRQTAAGVVAGLTRKLDELSALANPLTQALQQAAVSFDYQAEEAFVDGSYLAELQLAANERGLVLVERDGRITAFPLLLKLEAHAPAVRVGRRLERQIRPAVLTAHLKKMQDGAVFNAAAFLEMLFKAAAHLAPDGTRTDAPRLGAVVPLANIHDLLTLRPGAAADYPREAFVVDLLRLDRLPDTRTRRGHSFSLPASTGSKGRARLTVYDEAGAEQVFAGIAFRSAGH